MKFGKQLKKEMVDGWEEACMDYNGLKRMLEDIRRDGDIECQVLGAAGIEDREKIKVEFCLPAETEDTKIMFFKKVDDEVKKVSAFYKGKVDEVMEEGGALLKQMDAVVALRKKVDSDMTSAVEEEDCEESKPVSATSSSDEQKPPDSSQLIHHPKSNVKGILEESEANNNSSFSKQELKEVEGSLELAFLDFCRQVHRLNQYRF